MNNIRYSIIALASVSALASSLNAQTVPVTLTTAQTNLLAFNGGSDSTIKATYPSVVNSNPSAKTGTTGGWGVSAKGGLNLLGLGVTTARATVETDNGSLSFGTESGGVLGSIVSANVVSTWEASASIPGSSSWAGIGDTVSYNFQLDRGNGVLGLGVGVLPDLTLVISDDSGVLYSAADAGALLGLANLSNASVSASASFVYNRAADGDLKIEWHASQLVTANLLSNGQEVYKISENAFTVTPAVVPEPSSALLLGLGASSLLLRRRK